MLRRRVLAAIAVVVAGLAAAPSAAETTTYDCTVTVGSPTVSGSQPHYDGSALPVAHSVGGCRLVTLTTAATVVGVDPPDGCRVVAKRPGTGEVAVGSGTQLATGDDVWGHCEVGTVEAVVSMTVEGGATSEPPEDLHALDRIVPIEVASAHDGNRLRGHVYLPEGPGPFATVLEYSPYWNTEYGPSEEQDEVVDGRRTMRGWHRPFMDAGFAVALVNIRGTGESDGCMEWGSTVERADVHTVVEALADQAWSNGNIGMFGLSYPGWTQWMAVSQAPPSLKAIVPASAVIDYHSLVTRNGARLLVGPATSTLWQAGGAGGAFAAFSAAGNDRFVPDTGPDHLTCPGYAEDAAAHAQLAADGERTPYFEVLDLRPAVAGTRVPALVTSGLTFDDGSVTQFEGVWDLLRGPKRFLLGQWGHDLPTRPDFGQLAVDWFDRYLRGPDRERPSAVTTGIVEYQDTDGTWYVDRAWPPRANTQTVLLSSGTLIDDPDEVVSSSASFQSSGIGYARLCNVPDHVRYVSPPLGEDVHLAGNFTVDLTLTSDLPEGNLVAHVWAVDAAGGCADPHRQVTRAMTTLRHAPVPGYGRDFPLLTPTPVSLTSLPFASTLRAGQRLVLTVSGDASELLPDARKPYLTVSTGVEVAGALSLPVVRGRLVFADEEGGE